MSFDLKLFGDKLFKCRDHLQLTIREVSSDLGIDSNRLVSLEKGEVIPNGDEILMFADYFKQDYHFFINNEHKTAMEQINILYRKFGDHFSKQDRHAVQEFIYLCESEQLAYDLLEKEHLNFKPQIKGNFYKSHGIDAAKELRIKFGLKPNDLINDPYQRFRKLGIHIFRRKLENSSISGLFIMHPKAGKCILVNYDEDIFRQNFTVAHEVAHALFDSGNEVNVSFESWQKSDLKEIRANNFASSFLIPLEALQSYKNINWSNSILQSLAVQLKVNIQPLVFALKEANIITVQQSNIFKSYKIPISEKEDPELLKLTEKRKQIKETILRQGLSDHYVKTCYSCYENELISAQRLAEMLLIDENELELRLSLHNFKLKYEY